MDYFVKGRIELASQEDVAKILLVEEEINQTPIKNGYASRRYYGGTRPDLFTFQSRSVLQEDAMILVNLFKDLIEVELMIGWIGWHACYHEDSINQVCEWDDMVDTTGGVG